MYPRANLGRDRGREDIRFLANKSSSNDRVLPLFFGYKWNNGSRHDTWVAADSPKTEITTCIQWSRKNQTCTCEGLFYTQLPIYRKCREQRMMLNCATQMPSAKSRLWATTGQVTPFLLTIKYNAQWGEVKGVNLWIRKSPKRSVYQLQCGGLMWILIYKTKQTKKSIKNLRFTGDVEMGTLNVFLKITWFFLRYQKIIFDMIKRWSKDNFEDNVILKIILKTYC